MPKTAAPINKIGRKRTLLGASFLSLGLLITAIWLWSGWHALSQPIAGKTVWLGHGSVGVSKAWFSAGGLVFFDTSPNGVRSSANQGPFWSLDGSFTFDVNPPPPAELDLRVLVLWDDEFGKNLSIALWPFALALLIGSGLLFRSGRHARNLAITNHCPICGYNLTGLSPESPCPECGKGTGRIEW